MEKIPVRSECHSYCTSANIKIFFLEQYSNDIWKNHILTVLITLLKKKYLLLYNKRVIAWILVNIVPCSVSYCTRMLMQYDILFGTIFTIIHAITLYYHIGVSFIYLIFNLSILSNVMWFHQFHEEILVKQG